MILGKTNIFSNKYWWFDVYYSSLVNNVQRKTVISRHLKQHKSTDIIKQNGS